MLDLLIACNSENKQGTTSKNKTANAAVIKPDWAAIAAQSIHYATKKSPFMVLHNQQPCALLLPTHVQLRDET